MILDQAIENLNISVHFGKEYTKFKSFGTLWDRLLKILIIRYILGQAIEDLNHSEHFGSCYLKYKSFGTFWDRLLKI